MQRNTHERLAAHARATAVITHAHPLGQDGAVLVALTAALALHNSTPAEVFDALLAYSHHQPPLRERLAIASSWIARHSPSPNEVRARLGNGISAAESCVTAIYIAQRFRNDSFITMLDFVAACRGDVDTIGAMAGAIWGARNGELALPRDQFEQLEDPQRLRQVACDLHDLVVETTAAHDDCCPGRRAGDFR
ncbi:MAG: ADP-ribosylglycohydrolase family protein [Polyangiaceae bacterium]